MNSVLQNLAWVAAAAATGFFIAAICAGMLRMRRNLYLLVYVPLSIAYVATYLVWSKAALWALITHNWTWGLVGAAIAGLIAVRNVLSQPSSPRKRNAAFALDVVWPGVIYGVTDALLLSVLPVMAILALFTNIDIQPSWLKTAVSGAAALAASIAVTIAYHLGYPEFRSRQVWWTVLGNGIFTLAYVVTGSPLAAILPHLAMHVASVIHGRETTIQLPPHAVQSDKAA
jgi:hypothetical protein